MCDYKIIYSRKVAPKLIFQLSIGISLFFSPIKLFLVLPLLTSALRWRGLTTYTFVLWATVASPSLGR